MLEAAKIVPGQLKNAGKNLSDSCRNMSTFTCLAVLSCFEIVDVIVGSNKFPVRLSRLTSHDIPLLGALQGLRNAFFLEI